MITQEPSGSSKDLTSTAEATSRLVYRWSTKWRRLVWMDFPQGWVSDTHGLQSNDASRCQFRHTVLCDFFQNHSCQKFWGIFMMIHVNIIFCLKRCSQSGSACFLFFLWCQCIQPIQACYSMALLALFHTCARSGGCGAQHVGTTNGRTSATPNSRITRGAWSLPSRNCRNTMDCTEEGEEAAWRKKVLWNLKDCNAADGGFWMEKSESAVKKTSQYRVKKKLSQSFFTQPSIPSMSFSACLFLDKSI